MSEFADHLKKDVKLITSDSLFVILLVVLGVVAFIMGFIAASSYSSGVWGWQQFVTRHMIEESQRNAIVGYWQSILGVDAVIFIVIASMAMTAEKESGMVRYILTFKTDKRRFYLSKYLVLMMIAVYTVIVSLLAYVIVFSAMDMTLLSVGDLVLSMLFPLLTLLVFASIGLLISTVPKKKGAAIAIAVVLFFAISMVFSMGLSLAQSSVWQMNPNSPSENITASIPLADKILIYTNPLVLTYGTASALGTTTGVTYNSIVYFDAIAGVALGLAMIAVFLFIGLLSFSRERSEGGWLGGLKGIIKR